MAPETETLGREQCVYLAKLAEQAERYEEMATYMEKLLLSSQHDGDLTVEERNLFSVAYKNMVGSRRAAWRIVSSIEQKEEGRRNEDHVGLVKGYRTKIEAELANVCKRILDLLDSHLVPSASSSESKVFYLKMKGDYHRYIAEFKVGEERKAASDETMTAYNAAQNRILGEIEEQIEQILSLAFENYKSLEESLSSGLVEVFGPATGSPAPALLPAVKLYSLLHDILSPEAQLKLCSYFQAAAKKRSRRHLLETDEFVGGKSEGTLLDVVSMSTAYQKMKALCQNIRNEIYTDMEIHASHVLPSFVDLPNISASIYSAELCSRLRSFLVACPPPCPSPPVAGLVIATADFQRDLASWNISPVKGGVDAKELFHLYIILWIQDKRLSLLELCKLDKVKWSGVRTVHSTTPFVDDMYDRLEDILNEYDIIICRWPEYTVALENAVADIEKSLLETLDRQYADVLVPLKDSVNLKKFGLKYVQKLAKRSSMPPYTVPDELGILLNTMKRLLDVLRPKIETRLKSWGSCIPDGGGNAPPGERLGEVTVLLRSKFRNYIQAVVEKLADNTRGQNATKLKKILQDSKDTAMESDIRSRMQPLKDLLLKTINHLHSVFVANVFVAICRGFWDRMGQDVLNFLENRKENKSWYKASRVTVAVLDDTFASQMQQLLGNSLQEKDLEPPRSMLEVRSVLCKDLSNLKDSNSYY